MYYCVHQMHQYSSIDLIKDESTRIRSCIRFRLIDSHCFIKFTWVSVISICFRSYNGRLWTIGSSDYWIHKSRWCKKGILLQTAMDLEGYCRFLAHLSRKLRLSYCDQMPSSSVVRLSSVRPVVRPHFWKTSPLKPLGQFSSNCMWSLLLNRD